MLPHLAQVVDDIAVMRSMYTTHLAHEAALFLMHGGRILPTRPSLGAWVTYGLGSENQNLPAYVVLDDPKGLPINFIQNWQSGWLPPVYQGTRLRSEGSPILNLHAKQEYPSGIVDLSRSLLHRMDVRIGTGIRATSNWRRGSPVTNWRRACRWRRPTRWTSTKRARRRKGGVRAE